MLNNLSQPVAGLLVSLFAGVYGAGAVIVSLSLVTSLLGPLVAAIWLRRTMRPVALDQP
jgi:hypothetical protein